MSRVEARLQDAGIGPPEVDAHVANHVPSVEADPRLRMCGQGPRRGGSPVIRSIVGHTVSDGDPDDGARLRAFASSAVVGPHVRDLDGAAPIAERLVDVRDDVATDE